MNARAPLPLVLFALLSLAACSTAGAPSGPLAPPSPSAGPATALLRATVTQAIAPVETFAWVPVALLTSDGRWLSQGPVPAIFPGPLLPNVLERSVGDDAWASVIAAARDAGLLDGPDLDPGPDVAIDLVGGGGLLGGQTAHVGLVVDGVRYDIAGDPTRLVRCDQGTRCPDPEPGTPEAFAAFWARLQDPATLLGDAVGEEHPFVPEAYAVLTGPAPVDESGLGVAPVPWPLSTPLATIGKPLTGEPLRRCAVVSGSDAATLRPTLQRATQLTAWVDPAVEGSRFGSAVRPMLPGDEDPCASLTGG